MGTGGTGGKEEEHYSCGCRKKRKVGSFFTQEKVRGCSEEESEKAKLENKQERGRNPQS